MSHRQSLGSQPLIVTLQLSPATAAKLTALRTKYFPKERNYLDAHVTYAQSLPAAKRARFSADLADLAARTARFPIHCGPPFSMGKQTPVKAVGINLTGGGQIASLRARLIRRWNGFDDIELSNQDLQNRKEPFHVTINNKDTPENAQACLDEVLLDWRDWESEAIGLELYEYQRSGHWKFLERHSFTGPPPGTRP